MTTLTEARRALLHLANLLPAPSIHANHLAIVSDYFDNQVPLNIENNALIQRLAVSEAFAKRIGELLAAHTAAAESTLLAKTLFNAAREEDGNCTAIVSARCSCTACRVRANA